MVTVVHVGVFEVLTFAYVVVTPGTTLPHTNTSAKESVAEIPVNVTLAVPITEDNDPRAEVADTFPNSLAETFASALTSGLAESTTALADTPEK